MIIVSAIKKITKIPVIRKLNNPLVRFLRFLQRVFAPETCWESDHCNVMREFGFEKTFNNKESCDVNGDPIPWYSYPAIEFLRQINFKKGSVFEYGSGNSTFWWGKQAEKVTAVEHDVEWYEKFNGKWASNTTVLLCKDADCYMSAPSGLYDVIIIDGNWRDLCAIEALKHIKDDGMIILDDAQRVQSMEEYQKALEMLRADPRFIQIDFYGFAPIVVYTKVTTVFISREKNMEYKGSRIPCYGIGNLYNE